MSASEASDESSGGRAVFDKGGAGFEAVVLLAFASLPCPFLLTLGLQHICLCHNMLQMDQGEAGLEPLCGHCILTLAQLACWSQALHLCNILVTIHRGLSTGTPVLVVL